MNNPIPAHHFPAPASPCKDKRKAAPTIPADDDGWDMTEEEEDAAAIRLIERVKKEGMLSREESDKVTARLQRLLDDED